MSEKKRPHGLITERIRSLCRDGMEAATASIVDIASGRADNITPAHQIRV